MENVLKKAYKLSLKVRQNSYSPYSKFKVGAALITLDNQIFTGCNVENVSYGATICAERTALVKAISQGEKNFKEIIVTTYMKDPAYPCAICLQCLSELCSADLKIHIANLEKIKETYLLKEFLPKSFKEFRV